MPRYVIQRTLGTVSDEELEAAAENSRRVREADFPEIVWEHSHVVHVGDGLKTYCVYSAPDAQMVRDHAAAAGLPADDVEEIKLDILG
jgi:hypothetical protein